MAKKHLEQYDKDGNRLDIYLNDDEVMVGDQTLADKLDDMDEAIEDASDGGYAPPEGGIPKTDLAQSVQDALDAVSSKANAADVVKGINDSNGNALPKNGNGVVTLPAIQEPLQYDEQPTQNSTKMVKSGGIYTALQALLSNISIGQNGNWYIGQTDTTVKAQGPKGNSVADGDTFDIVNNLYDGGEEDGLSAEMGKVLKHNVMLTIAKVNELIDALAGIAYIGTPVSELSGLNWDSTVVHVMLANGSGSHLELSGTFSGTTWTGTMSVKSADAASYGLPFADDISAVMAGSAIALAYDDSTGAITIEGVTSDVKITAIPSAVHGVDINGQPVRWKTGYYISRGINNADETRFVEDSRGAYSDLIPVTFAAGDTLQIEYGTSNFGSTNTTIPYFNFYNASKEYFGHISPNSGSKRSTWTIPSDNNAINTAYIRLSVLWSSVGDCYALKNGSTYIIKGNNVT